MTGPQDGTYPANQPGGWPPGAPVGGPQPGFGPPPTPPGSPHPGQQPAPPPGYAPPAGQPGWGPAAPPPGYGAPPAGPYGGPAGPPNGGYPNPGFNPPNFPPQPTGVLPLVSTNTVKRRKGPKIAAAAIAATCLVGSGVFAYASLSGGDDGAKTPEAAMESFFAALGQEDAIGVLNTLPAGERRTMVPLVTEMVSEMSRLGVLNEGADASKVTGFDLEFTDLTFESDALSDNVATVRLTGGTVEGSYDLAQLPLGDALIDNVFDGEAPEGTERDTTEIEDGDFPEMVAIKEDGGWHVSLWYSVAEAARNDADLPTPQFGAGVPAVGADSPEAAVEELFAALGTLDVRRMIELTAPDEAAALHDYAPLFLDDAEDAVDELFAENDVKLTVQPTGLTTSEEDGRTIVNVSGFEGNARIDGERVEFSVQDGCGTLTADGEELEGCLEDLQDQVSGGQAEALDLFDNLQTPSIDIATVEVDGAWYVSPTFTIGQSMLSVLRAAEEGDIEALFDTLSEGMSGGFDLGASLNNDVLGGLGGTAGGAGGFEDDVEDDLDDVEPVDDGYSRYFDACGDFEFDLFGAANTAEWATAMAQGTACAAPFIAAGDIGPADVPNEFAYPECFAQWPWEPSLTLSQQSAILDQIDTCVQSKS